MTAAPAAPGWPSCRRPVVAEFALAAVLAHAKRLPETRQAEPGARWPDFRLDTLERRVIGVVGYGRIGQAVTCRARAFGMTVLAHTRTPRPDTPDVRFVTDQVPCQAAR